MNENVAVELNKVIRYDQVARIHNEAGEHVLSILRCHDDEDCLDLATPDGKVVRCETVDMVGDGIFSYLLATVRRLKVVDLEDSNIKE